jgi:hypothetical protein
MGVAPIHAPWVTIAGRGGIFAVRGVCPCLNEATPAVVMAGLSDPVRIHGPHGDNAIGSMPFSGRYIVLALVAIAVIVVILWIPVLSDQISAALSATAPTWAPIMLLAGTALLGLGLTVHVGPLEVTGGVLIGLVALAFFIDNY